MLPPRAHSITFFSAEISVKVFCCLFDQSFLHPFDGKYRSAIALFVSLLLKPSTERTGSRIQNYVLTDVFGMTPSCVPLRENIAMGQRLLFFFGLKPPSIESTGSLIKIYVLNVDVFPITPSCVPLTERSAVPLRFLLFSVRKENHQLSE